MKDLTTIEPEVIAYLEHQPRDHQIRILKLWCKDNYDAGADTMVECWGTEDYEALFRIQIDAPLAEQFRSGDGVKSFAEAYETLFHVASAYADQIADANFHRAMNLGLPDPNESYSRDADRIDGMDRDDLGESPDY